MRAAIVRLVATAMAAGVGYVVGWVFGMAPHIHPRPEKYPFLAEFVHLPHHVPRDPGGLALRFPRHGSAYYRERNRLTREKLDALAPDDPARFPLEDDLGVGLERLGQSEE